MPPKKSMTGRLRRRSNCMSYSIGYPERRCRSMRYKLDVFACQEMNIWQKHGSVTGVLKYIWGLQLWPENCEVLWSVWELAALSLPICRSLPRCKKPSRELVHVWSVLQESHPLIYRPLIRLALLGLDWANDEISPSFCVSFLSAPPFSLSHPVSVLHPSLAPFITTPCTPVMMHFMGNILLPYITQYTSNSVALFELRGLWEKQHQLNGEFPLCMMQRFNTQHCSIQGLSLLYTLVNL